MVVAIFAIVASASAQEATSSADGPTTVVVLVDLSGSLSVDDFAEEVRAVGIMNTVPGIEMYVIGFASEGTLPAFQVVCEPGDDLAECTQELARRSSAEGNDTDHAAALSGAAAILGSPEAASDAPKVVLVMTDGDYDPHGGGSPTEADRARLSDALAELRSANVSVWPLGFGRTSKATLTDLALAATDICKEPRGFIVPADEIPSAVNRIVGSLTCAIEFRGERYTVLPDTELVIVTYGQDELPGGTVTAASRGGVTETVTCDFEDVAAAWTCEISTNALGTGDWRLSPAPGEFTTPYQVAAGSGDVQTTTTVRTEASTTTTTTSATTTTVAETAPTTAVSVDTTAAVDAAAPVDDGSANLWPLVAAGVLGAAILAGALLYSRRGQSGS